MSAVCASGGSSSWLNVPVDDDGHEQAWHEHQPPAAREAIGQLTRQHREHGGRRRRAARPCPGPAPARVPAARHSAHGGTRRSRRARSRRPRRSRAARRRRGSRRAGSPRARSPGAALAHSSTTGAGVARPAGVPAVAGTSRASSTTSAASAATAPPSERRAARRVCGTSLKLSMSDSPARKQQDAGRQREDDAHRRTLSETMASRRGPRPSSNAIAPPNDRVSCMVERTREPHSPSASPMLVASVRTPSSSRLVASPPTNTAGRSHVAWKPGRADAAEPPRRQVPVRAPT